MSNAELFAFGLLVTLLMSAALAPLIWAAIQDGRYNDQQQELYREEALRAAVAPGRVVANDLQAHLLGSAEVHEESRA